MIMDLEKALSNILDDDINRIIISKPARKSTIITKIVIEKKKEYFQASKYDDKKVFHENVAFENILKYCQNEIEQKYRQVNAFSMNAEHIVLISKDGSLTYKTKKSSTDETTKKIVSNEQHNRKKNYIIEEGMDIPALYDMGIFTKEGKVVQSMYDKYKQINRFLEIIDDEIKCYKKDTLNIIDFGCGKSYLTFILYFYLTSLRKMKVNIIGLDLKADVIEKCNKTAKKYGYDNLVFCVGDVNGFKAPFDVNMVITLHACDTATDYALYNAIQWKSDMIFSVPCCQHELNKQINPQELTILSRYGIIKERFSALSTDVIRANLLEYCGYKTQVMEFVDFENTPKNLLLRAVKRPITPNSVRKKVLDEILELQKTFKFENTLYRLLDIDK